MRETGQTQTGSSCKAQITPDVCGNIGLKPGASCQRNHKATAPEWPPGQKLMKVIQHACRATGAPKAADLLRFHRILAAADQFCKLSHKLGPLACSGANTSSWCFQDGTQLSYSTTCPEMKKFFAKAHHYWLRQGCPPN